MRDDRLERLSFEEMHTNPAANPRQVQLLAFGVALLPFVGLAWHLDFLTDDAYIVFRIARNVVEGYGFNFNRGVVPPVEGYTQFLWIVWNAALIRVGLDVLIWSRITLVVAGASLLWILSGSVVRRYPERPGVAVLSTTFLAALPPIGAWATGGMETMVFTLFALLAYEALLADPQSPRGLRAGIWMGLMGLTRADAPYLIAVLLLSAAVSWFFWHRTRPMFMAIATATGIAVTTVLGYVAWRYSYFGDLLPNTAYTKVTLSAVALERGSNYVIEFFLTYPFIGLMFALGIGTLVGDQRARRRPEAVIVHALLICLGACGYAVIVGGDFMPFRRFLVPMLPFVALLFAALLARYLHTSGRSKQIAIVLAGASIAVTSLPAFGYYPTPHALRERFHYNWNIKYLGAYEQWAYLDSFRRNWIHLGVALKEHADPDDTLVMGTIGAVGYYSDLFIFDSNGLVTPSVARRPGLAVRRSPGHDKEVNASFFLSEEPTYLDAVIVEQKLAEEMLAAERAAIPGPLARDYEWVSIPLADAPGYPQRTALVLFQRRAEFR